VRATLAPSCEQRSQSAQSVSDGGAFMCIRFEVTHIIRAWYSVAFYYRVVRLVSQSSYLASTPYVHLVTDDMAGVMASAELTDLVAVQGALDVTCVEYAYGCDARS
jgi:hypothetical protein